MLASNVPAMVSMGISTRPKRRFFGLCGGGSESTKEEPKKEPKESDKLYDLIMELSQKTEGWRHIGDSKWIHDSGLALQIFGSWFYVSSPVKVESGNFTNQQGKDVAHRFGQMAAQKVREAIEAHRNKNE